MGNITAERLREALHYDPETGSFTWRINRRAIRAGNAAGTKKSNGYIQIRIDQKTYLAHRLAWLYMTGDWPPHTIDHSNTDVSDNRFRNLREATQSQNNGNANLTKKNTSGRKGVSWKKSRGKWVASIHQKHIGIFENLDDAAKAYAKAAQEYFGEFARW
jgi:hypothetical protein